MKEILIPNLKHLSQAAKDFVSLMDSHRVFAFYGEMGAGKTTFVRALCQEMGVNEVVNSPTFAIVNEYEIESEGEVIYHFDFYRINKIEEVFDMGYEDYFYSGRICLIEWPELVESLLPDNVVRVEISVKDDGSRVLTIDTKE